MANVTVEVYRKYLFPESYASQLDPIILLQANFMESEVVKEAPRLAKQLALAVIQADTKRNWKEYAIENVGNRYENSQWEIADEPDEDDMIKGKCNHIVSATPAKRDNDDMYIICYQLEMRYKQPKG